MLTTQITLTDAELVSRLANTEDPFVERKTAGDIKDVLKTAVAFANTLPVGIPGVLFIPVMDSGQIQRDVNLDQLQKNVSTRIAEAYPSIGYFQRVISKDGNELIAVQIWGSPNRPHFAGASYVRDGSQTMKASTDQFAALIARRSSKVEELSKWLGKRITTIHIAPGTGPRVSNALTATVEVCTQWYVTVKYEEVLMSMPQIETFVWERVQISFDDARQRLAIEVGC